MAAVRLPLLCTHCYWIHVQSPVGKYIFVYFIFKITFKFDRCVPRERAGIIFNMKNESREIFKQCSAKRMNERTAQYGGHGNTGVEYYI